MKLAVMDLDGCIAMYPEELSVFDHDTYVRTMDTFEVNPSAKFTIEQHTRQGHRIYCLSCRSEEFLERTKQWFRLQALSVTTIHLMPLAFAAHCSMLRETVGPEDVLNFHAQFKRTVVEQLLADGDEVVAYYDDNMRNVRSVASLGVESYLLKQPTHTARIRS